MEWVPPTPSWDLNGRICVSVADRRRTYSYASRWYVVVRRVFIEHPPERFLARSTVPVMDPSKIGFSALQQFYYLEIV